MTKEEIKDYLTANLSLNIELRGMGRDDIVVELILGDEVIDTAFIEGWHIRALQNE